MAARDSRRLRLRLRLRLRGGGVIFAAPGDSFAPAVLPLHTQTAAIDARVSWVQLEIPGASLTPRRALWLDAGALRQISDALIGTGKKPVVILSGALRERATTEGVPVIIDGGSLHCLNSATEQLLI